MAKVGFIKLGNLGMSQVVDLILDEIAARKGIEIMSFGTGAKMGKAEAAGDTNNIHEIKDLIKRVNSLHEFNPMLGHRGCRLGITYPEIYEMQVRAIFEAACELVKDGYEIVPEVMIPLVGHINEFKVTRDSADAVAKQVMEEQGVELDYMIGTMIELPRAAITADEIATEAEFFSFGTNDLTQTTFGLSRDDAGKFLPYYVEIGILENDPFVAIDQDGVGQLVKMGVDKGRSSRPDLKIGICGEHGGEPGSVIFCHNIGLDYVSCSPFRVPIARLAAAHAVLKKGE
jgi:pyruvate,orthophosphate dikinase